EVVLYDCDILDALASDPDCALKVEGIQLYNRNLSDPCWARIKAFTNLRSLNIEDSEPANFFDKLDGIPSLESVRIDCRVTDSTIRFFASCPKLRYVYLSSSEGFRPDPLTGHPAIQDLSIANCRINDEWVRVLKSLPKLRKL